MKPLSLLMPMKKILFFVILFLSLNAQSQNKELKQKDSLTNKSTISNSLEDVIVTAQKKRRISTKNSNEFKRFFK